MPDPTNKTVSATQVPALFGHSPYLTRFMLHEHFVGRTVIDTQSDDRMDWGTRVQPAILQWCADNMRLDLIGIDETYARHPNATIGCTPDGFVNDPQKGLGVVEAKNVDYLRWRDTWTDDHAPWHIELQLATQMMVPDKLYGDVKWGVIACLVGGNDLKLYERKRDKDLENRIFNEAAVFLIDVTNDNVPPVQGLPIEIPALMNRYPEADKEQILGEHDFDDAEAVREMIREHAYWAGNEGSAKKLKQALQVQIMEMMGEAGVVLLPGCSAKLSKWETKATVIEKKAGRSQRLTTKYDPTMFDTTPAILRGED